MTVPKTKDIFIFIPNTLDGKKKGYLEGFHKDFSTCEAFFVTNNQVVPEQKHSNLIGYVGDSEEFIQFKKGIRLDLRSKVSILTKKNSVDHHITKIVYDYSSFTNSFIVRNSIDYGEHFQELINFFRKRQSEIQVQRTNSIFQLILLVIIKLINVILKFQNLIKKTINCSSTIDYFEETLVILISFLNCLLTKELCPKLGNLFVSKLFDILLGIYVIKCFFENEDDIDLYIEDASEGIIIKLSELLTYLMGSPIGLKLNHAFNNALGSFFFYHISLWRVFLRGMNPLILDNFHTLIMSGIFGFSFQLALFSDILSFVTFHVYCIYVYAAKLFQLQVEGIVSLWRLFTGRKYNPLRDRVDSCQYSQHQLFIGTLGFTILLFLLPTTALYYFVFTTLRLTLLTADSILRKVRYFIKCLPVYITILWIFNSSQIAGSLFLSLSNGEENCVQIEAHLKTLPLFVTITKFIPEETIEKKKKSSWTSVIHKIFTGVLI